MFASRADLLAPKPRRFGTETLPASGLTVRFRSLMEGEYAAYEMARQLKNENGGVEVNQEGVQTTRARLIALCLCDDSGNLIFSEADVEGISEKLEVADSMFLFVKLQEHCGLMGTYSQIIASREAAKKNLSETSGDDSPAS